MELVVELVVQVFGEVLFEGLFELFGWVLRRRWGRLLLGVVVGSAGGLAWVALGHTGMPLVGSGVVAAQALAIPFLEGREVAGRVLERRGLTDLALVGAAVLVPRWIGWAVASA